MFKYMLATDGEVFDSFESMRCDWQAGDEFIGHGNTHWRVTAVVPGERIGEFVDGRRVNGLLEVELSSVPSWAKGRWPRL